MTSDSETQQYNLDRESLHKEIDLIQGCISRVTNNSFLLKGWAITLLAIVLSISEKQNNHLFIAFVTLVPLTGFWLLDSFFLQTEKKYRALYDWVLEKRKEGDFSFQYNLNPNRFSEGVGGLGATMFSITLRWFYGIPTLIVIGTIIYLSLRK